MKRVLIITIPLFLFLGSYAQEVNLNKTFPSIEMTAVKMLDETTLYRVDTVMVKLGKYQLGEIACNVILKDMNNNGKYNDIGIDEIGLLDQFTDTILHSYQGGLSYARINDSPAVLVDDMLLKAENIADDGSKIEFIEVDEGSLIALAWTATYLPYLNLKTLSGKDANLVDFLQEEKYIYIEFWGTWCDPCVKLIPEIGKIASKYEDKVKVIGLNYGDKLEDAIAFVKMNQLSWEQLVVEREALAKFSVTTIPRGILFDKAGKLIDMNISPSKLKEFLSSTND